MIAQAVIDYFEDRSSVKLVEISEDELTIVK